LTEIEKLIRKKANFKASQKALDFFINNFLLKKKLNLLKSMRNFIIMSVYFVLLD